VDGRVATAHGGRRKPGPASRLVGRDQIHASARCGPQCLRRGQVAFQVSVRITTHGETVPTSSARVWKRSAQVGSLPTTLVLEAVGPQEYVS
jgi:hypothetical protein